MTTVYLVDDDPLVTDSLGTAFRLETDYDVYIFQSGPAALVALSSTPPDIVISDFKMPGMDGLALLRAVRQAVPDAVLMLLTGYADKESAIQAINQVGIAQYVEKPWNLDDLLQKIRAGLERRQLVTDLRAANADLEKRNAELSRTQDKLVNQERLAAVGRVVTGLAHEIGNQLALVGYAEAIKARAGEGTEIGELADVIVAAQKRLAAMVTDIKDFVRAGDWKGPQLEPADVVAVVEEALGILRWDREVAQHTLARDVRARPLAKLDRRKFGQVIINLVRNAAQASAQKSKITVVVDEDAEGVLVIIADEGPGIPPEVLARLGEPFFSTRGEVGTGLGLVISRKIAEKHGGSLTIDSTPGAGTRVTIRLPRLA
jgi:signal transduction histidine kinase